MSETVVLLAQLVVAVHYLVGLLSFMGGLFASMILTRGWGA